MPELAARVRPSGRNPGTVADEETEPAPQPAPDPAAPAEPLARPA